MGNCACAGKVKRTTLDQIREKLIIAIESGRLDIVEHCYRRYMVPQSASMPAEFQVDDWIIELQDVKLNSLAYAFRAGQTAIVKFLVEKGKASLTGLYNTYQKFGRTPVDVACEYGFLNLLQFFLPFHLSMHPAQPENQLEVSLFSEPHLVLSTLSPDFKSPMAYQPAILRACERGHIPIVEWLVGYFDGMDNLPSDFDVNEKDERAGENCALVAARQGNLQMVKFLHLRTNADFHTLNRRNENVIQISAIGSKRKDARNYLECIRYLIETIGVDVTYEYEETLLICEDRNLVVYLESQLQKRGIEASKEKVDNEYSLTKNREPRVASKHSQELEAKFKNAGACFQLCEIFDVSQSRSYLSSIPQRSALDVSELSVV